MAGSTTVDKLVEGRASSLEGRANICEVGSDCCAAVLGDVGGSGDATCEGDSL